MPSPRLTVAIPTCNGARHVPEALASILAQGDVPFDLLVTDDRSDDETVALVRTAAGDRARIEVNPERLGLAGNWNRAVELCRTPFVAIFHQDDVMAPGHLAAHLKVYEAHPGVALICGAATVIDDAGRPVPPTVVERPDLGPADFIDPPGAFLARLAASNPVRCSAVSMSVPAHAEAGGFDPSYRYAVDWDFWIRVARRHSVAWLAQPTVAVRWHPASETHRFKKGTADLDEELRLLDRLYQDEGLAPASRRAADHRLGRAFLNRAYEAARGGDPSLSRRCLRRAIDLWPGILLKVAADPRLIARLLAGNLSRRPSIEEGRDGA